MKDSFPLKLSFYSFYLIWLDSAYLHKQYFNNLLFKQCNPSHKIITL